MIIITDEMLLNAFGNERVPFSRDLFMYSLKSLIEREEYGKDITAITQYEPQWYPQGCVDNWMNSTIAKTEVAEYYKELSFKGEDDMNKYETLLKKYQALYKDFEAYKEVTEGLATNGYYIKNEALEELLECKKKYEVLKEEQHAYCMSAEVVGAKLIETEKKYDELKKDYSALSNTIDSIYEGKRKLKEEREGIKKENDSLYKEFTALKKERDDLVKEVYYLHEVINEKNSKCKEKMDKIKQRDKQITELVKRRDIKDKQMTELIKERDNLAKRLEHINAMSNLEWEFEVVEETETQYDSCIGFAEIPSTTPYDELVAFCENHEGSCTKCPNVIACDGINKGFRPAKWNEDEIAEYNELMNMDIAEYCNNAMNNKEDK